MMTIPEDSLSKGLQASGAAAPPTQPANTHPHISDAEIEKLSKTIFSNISSLEKYKAIEATLNALPNSDGQDISTLYQEIILGIIQDHDPNDLMKSLDGGKVIETNPKFAYQLALQCENYRPIFFDFAIKQIQSEEFNPKQFIISSGINPKSNQGQKMLIEIAKLAAQQDGGGTSECIQKYGIKDQNALIEIAKLAAQQDGWGTSECILTYRIKDQNALIEIAKLAAQQDGWGTTQFIQNYGIKDQNVLIEIAKLAAQQDGGGTSRHIQEYGIQDQGARIEIAKVASDQNPYSTAKSIENYFIVGDDDTAKNTLITIAFEGLGLDISENFKLYSKLSDFLGEEHQTKFLLSALFRASEHINGKAIEKLSQFFDKHPVFSGLTIFNPYIKVPENFTYADFLNHNIKEMHEYLKTKGEDNPLLTILDEIRQIKAKDQKTTLFLQKNSMLWLHLSILYFESEGVVMQAGDLPLLQHILRMQDPGLRYTLSQQFAKMAKNPESREAFDRLRKGVKDSTASVSSKRYPIIELTTLMLAINFPDVGVNKRVLSKVLGGDFIDAAKGRLLLHVLGSVSRKQQLNDEQKVVVLNKIFNEKASAKGVIANLKAVEGILSYHKPEKLLDDHDLPTIFLEIFKNLIPIQMEASYFGKKYSEIIEKFRLPLSLATYAAKMNQLVASERKGMLTLLGEFVTHLFKGDFKEWRYDTEKSPHLQQLAAGAPQVWENWKEGMKLSKIKIKGDKDVKLPDFKAMMLESFRQGHMADGAYPLLRKYLESSVLSKGIEPDSVEDFGIKLAQVASVKEAVTNLETMIKAKTGSNDQFTADLEGWHSELTKSRSDAEQLYNIVDTDDPCDLLLAGTEVSGSCQNVGGAPNLNKCLMAYVADGKNRMIAIKDPATGRIIARSIIRLLLDKKTNRPVMFLERVYPGLANEKMKSKIIKYAIKRAADLGVPLLTQQAAKGIPYRGEIVSLGGRAPFEYEDAGEGVIPRSVYTLEGLVQL